MMGSHVLIALYKRQEFYNGKHKITTHAFVREYNDNTQS